MIQLKPCKFSDIQSWFVDYQKKSKNYEMPVDQSELLGIYKAEELIGYFIITSYTNNILEINQGYLKPEARHKSYSRIAMSLLEKAAKSKGLIKISLGTNRAVGSYQKFMRDMGYSLTRAVFTKEL